MIDHPPVALSSFALERLGSLSTRPDCWGTGWDGVSAQSGDLDLKEIGTGRSIDHFDPKIHDKDLHDHTC